MRKCAQNNYLKVQLADLRAFEMYQQSVVSQKIRTYLQACARPDKLLNYKLSPSKVVYNLAV